MAYATVQDMLDRFGETTVVTSADRDGDGVLDGAAIARALDDASGEIDAYLAARYSLPLPQVPALLVRLTCEMALHLVSLDAGTATEEKEKRYKRAVELLVGISKGTVELGLESSSAPSLTAPEVRGPPRLFGRHSLKGIL